MRNINRKFFHEGISSIYNMRYFILLGIFFLLVLILTGCATKFSHSNYHCLVNKDDNLKYLDSFNKNLFILKIPKDLDVHLPTPCVEYDIPMINLELINSKESNVNICPPKICDNILNESCFD